MKQMLWLLSVLLIMLLCAGCDSEMETMPTETTGATVAAETTPEQPTVSQIVKKPTVPPVTYPVIEKEYPKVPELWKVAVDKSVRLYGSAEGTDVITWIYPGETMELLDWRGLYAKVRYEGIKGYVLSSLIMPADEQWIDNCLNTVEVTAVYSFEQMCADMETLSRKYRDVASIDTVGYTENGLQIPVLVLGNLSAPRHVLLQGAMHGREYMSAWLLMAMVDCWLDQGIFAQDKVCFHVIPMTNPDGVKISQSGELNETQTEIYQSDRRKGYTYLNISDYASQWKANALGVDINRSFPSGWYWSMMRHEPSSQRYGGRAPYSAAEAVALRDYTQRYPFDITISYHSSGCIIYYEFGNQKRANKASKELALAVKEFTGYDLAGSGGVDGAGYKDWAIDVMQIPSLTVEIGCGDSPLDENEIYSIFARNLDMLPTLLKRLLP